MSEELADVDSKTLLYPMRTGNHYRSVWTVGAEATSTFAHHEFKLFRFAEVRLLGDAAFNTTNTCQEVAESDTQGSPPAQLSLHCPQAGGRRLIESVAFASYGTPTGACAETGRGKSPNTDCSGEEHGGGGCGDHFRTSSCNAASSKGLVEKHCVGKPACTLPVSAAFFGDPCPGVRKRLAVDVSCGNVTLDTDTAARPSEISTAVTLNLSAWRVRYPFSEDDFDFESSDSMLNAVWNLSVNTLRVTSLDTVRKTLFFGAVLYANDQFTKTGSGQT